MNFCRLDEFDFEKKAENETERKYVEEKFYTLQNLYTVDVRSKEIQKKQRLIIDIHPSIQRFSSEVIENFVANNSTRCISI